MDLEYLKEHIEEELCGAKDYIKRAIEIKPMDATWSKTLVEMSAKNRGMSDDDIASFISGVQSILN